MDLVILVDVMHDEIVAVWLQEVYQRSGFSKVILVQHQHSEDFQESSNITRVIKHG